MENFYIVFSYLKTIAGARTKCTNFTKKEDAEKYINKCKKRKTYDGYRLYYYNYNMQPNRIEKISEEI